MTRRDNWADFTAVVLVCVTVLMAGALAGCEEPQPTSPTPPADFATLPDWERAAIEEMIATDWKILPGNEEAYAEAVERQKRLSGKLSTFEDEAMQAFLLQAAATAPHVSKIATQCQIPQGLSDVVPAVQALQYAYTAAYNPPTNNWLELEVDSNCVNTACVTVDGFSPSLDDSWEFDRRVCDGAARLPDGDTPWFFNCGAFLNLSQPCASTALFSLAPGTPPVIPFLSWLAWYSQMLASYNTNKFMTGQITDFNNFSDLQEWGVWFDVGGGVDRQLISVRWNKSEGFIPQF